MEELNMNVFKIAKRLIQIANVVDKFAARELISTVRELVSFDMTEREWEHYKKEHPNADKRNHHIIPVKGLPHHKSNYKEYMVREKKAKKKYFRELKKKHPNFEPIVRKDDIEQVLKHGEYSCISAGINPEMPEDIENAKKDKNFIKNRTEALRKDLDRLGVKYTEITGSYGSEEPSFLISHTLEAKVGQKNRDNSFFVKRNKYDAKDMVKKLNALGTKYNQDSVAHGRAGKMEWHYTTGEKKGKRVKGLDTQFLKGAKDFYSEARVGDDHYTKWSCDMSPAWEDESALVDNPYYPKD